MRTKCVWHVHFHYQQVQAAGVEGWSVLVTQLAGEESIYNGKSSKYAFNVNWKSTEVKIPNSKKY